MKMLAFAVLGANLILSRVTMNSQRTVFTNKDYRGDLVLTEEPSNIGNLQIVKLENGVTIANHHGYWDRNPMGVEQSSVAMARVADELRRESDPLVLCGDLNVVHASPVMRHLGFLRDLIDEDEGIKTTLSGLGFDGGVVCGHILVNDGVKVKNIELLADIVSDHLPVLAELE